MRLLLLACVGGALGSGLRHLVNVGALRLFGPEFPVGTLTVNAVGSLLMGVLVELVALRFDASPELRVLVTTGVLGGFTTFSAFSLDFVLMMERGAYFMAAVYLVASVTVSILAVVGGLTIGRMVFQ
jgi:CrcB protein